MVSICAPFTQRTFTHLILLALQRAFLTGECDPAPAAAFLGHTKKLYGFIPLDLAIPTHGRENLEVFGKNMEHLEFVLGQSEETIGSAVSHIYRGLLVFLSPDNVLIVH